MVTYAPSPSPHQCWHSHQQWYQQQHSANAHACNNPASMSPSGTSISANITPLMQAFLLCDHTRCNFPKSHTTLGVALFYYTVNLSYITHLYFS
jgi:hypothetical protein